ncbi:MAG: hypothetical protein MZV70_33100 [Desulfobacterales bacterium]|nr:hypothetical protein [Desulfobacterales bacterium]
MNQKWKNGRSQGTCSGDQHPALPDISGESPAENGSAPAVHYRAEPSPESGETHSIQSG